MREEDNLARNALGQTARLSRNARMIWFGHLSLLVLVGVILKAHRDVDFFLRDATATLPLIEIDVPVLVFFYVAPVLVMALYTALHLYLFKLWGALADAPARIDDAPLIYKLPSWPVSDAAVCHRAVERDDGSAGPWVIVGLTGAMGLLLGWIVGVVVLSGLWIRSMPRHDILLTGVCTVCLLVAVGVGAKSYLNMRAQMRSTRRDAKPKRWMANLCGVTLTTLVVFCSLEGTWRVNAIQLSKHLKSHWHGSLPSRANLEEVQFTQHPQDWLSFETWLRDYRHLNAPRLVTQHPMVPTEVEIREWNRVIETLEQPSLGGVDLRGAILTSAVLTGADLRRAKLDHARMRWVGLEGADLRGATMKGVYLVAADMQAADLDRADLELADLLGAKLHGASMSNARLSGANLNKASLPGAILKDAVMHGVDMSDAQLQGVVLTGAKAGGSVFSGADLSEDTSCASADFQFSLLENISFKCLGLQPDQLHGSIGDRATFLPQGVKIVTCLQKSQQSAGDIQTINRLSHHHPAEGGQYRLSRAEFLDQLFCDEDEEANLVPNR